ncbi:MFS transporter [Actinoplanes sp. NPDC048988]|uniref:MFS transporter n=1 Tax=Actinoplanes sp. NPDC048988 TaxID=3363901 RepID=UPI0037172E67
MTLTRYVGAAVCARLADEGARVAILLLALDQTGDEALGGLLIAALMVPHVVAAPITGALADAVHRRRLFYVLAFLGYAGALLTGAELIAHSTWAAAAFLILAGCCAPLLIGGLSSLLPDLVPARLERAFGFDVMSYSIAGIAGPALAAVLADLAGASWSVVGLVTLVVAGAVLVASLPLGTAPRPASPHTSSDRSRPASRPGTSSDRSLPASRPGTSSGGSLPESRPYTSSDRFRPASRPDTLSGRPQPESRPHTSGGRPVPVSAPDISGSDSTSISPDIPDDRSGRTSRPHFSGGRLPSDPPSDISGDDFRAAPASGNSGDGSQAAPAPGISGDGSRAAPAPGISSDGSRVAPAPGILSDGLRATAGAGVSGGASPSAESDLSGGASPWAESDLSGGPRRSVAESDISGGIPRPVAALDSSGGEVAGGEAVVEKAGGAGRRRIQSPLAAVTVMVRRPRLGAVTLGTIFSMLGVGALPLVAALLADEAGRDELTGLVLSAGAAGGLLTSLVLTKWPIRRRPPEWVVAVSLAATSVPFLLLILLPVGWAGLPLFAVAGALGVPVSVAVFAVRDQEAPPEIRTQVFTLGAGVKVTAAAAGAALAGLAAPAGIVALLAGIAVCQVLGALAVVVVPRVTRAARPIASIVSQAN